jgi:hypothetical protein
MGLCRIKATLRDKRITITREHLTRDGMEHIPMHGREPGGRMALHGALQELGVPLHPLRE